MRKVRTAENGRMEVLRMRVARWRRTRGTRGAMPVELWAEAVALAQKAGRPCQVARAIGVDAGSLVRRIAGASRERALVMAPSSAARFVELGGAHCLGMSAAPEIVVEVTNVQGSRLMVRIGAGEGLDVASVVRGFCERGS